MKLINVKDLYYLSVVALIMIDNRFHSLRLREFIVSSIAFIAYKFSKKKRQLIEKNLSQAFDGNLSEEQRRKIVKGAFRESWQYVFSWSSSKAEGNVIRETEVRGLEHLCGALNKEMGVILWESNGLGKRNLAKRILYEKGFSVFQVHGADNLGGFLTENSSATWVRRSLINRFFENCEKQFVTEIINLPSSNSLAFTRILLNRLKQNVILCITGDGKTGQKLITLEFLGRTDLFSTGMVSLAKVSGAAILPMFCVKERNDKITLIIERPIHIEIDVDREHGLESSIAEYAGLLESYIRRYPEQYRNWHLAGESPANLKQEELAG